MGIVLSHHTRNESARAAEILAHIEQLVNFRVAQVRAHCGRLLKHVRSLAITHHGAFRRPCVCGCVAISAVHAVGLCLCVIVDELPRSSLPPSYTSPRSACISSAMSGPNFASVPVRTASACTTATRLSRCVCHDSSATG